MTIIDYLLLGAFAVAALYTAYRLLFGWLRTHPHQIESHISNRTQRSTVECSGRELAPEPVAQMAEMPGRFR